MNSRTLNIILAAVIVIILSLKCNKDKNVPTNTIPPKEVAAIAKDLKVKPEQVKTVVQYNTVTKSEIKVKRDTVVVYKDRWTEIKVDNTSKDSTAIVYSISDSVSVTSYEKKKWFLGAPRTLIDIKHSNPNVQTNSIRQYELPVKTKRWSIGIYTGYGWNGKEWNINVGIGIQRSIFKF